VTQKRPEISIVMPLYNKEHEVLRAISSILAQTFQDFELIVINDGSTDGGPEVVRKVVDHRIRVIDQGNAGVSAARNRGITEARANLVAFLDADDEWLPEFLQIVLRLSKSFPKCDVFGTKYLLRDTLGRCQPAVINGIPSNEWEGVLEDYFWVAAHSDPPLWSSAVAVKKDVISAVGGFPVGIRSGEDLLTWARLATRFSIAYSTRIGAVFWMPAHVTSRPGRFLQREDIVGQELRHMLAVIPENKISSFRSYLRRWHEMQAVTSLQLKNRCACLRHVRFAVHYAGLNRKLLLVAFLTCLPADLGCWLFSRIRMLKKRQNHSSPELE